MKKILFIFLAFLLVALPSCEEFLEDKAELSTINSNTTALPFEGGQCLTLTINANGSWILSTDEPWVILSADKGTDNQIVKATLTPNYTAKMRSATITLKSGSESSQLSISQASAEIVSIPADANLSLPQRNNSMEYKEYYVTYNNKKIFNYAIEWSPIHRHANWVALEFNATTRQENVTRTNEWDWDTSLSGEIEESMHKKDGFDKGHLCASSERLYSTEANEQTFYYSNISPMISDFNQGYWAELEKLVLDWCQSESFDKAFITKGGTINTPLINYEGSQPASDNVIPTTDANGLTKNGLFVPKYYFIAVLTVKNNAYQSIGFYVEHTEGLPKNPTADELKEKALSIDELETLTSIDFFCDMPDVMESSIEASYDVTKWTW